jgi:Tol biopolymer transport system component
MKRPQVPLAVLLAPLPLLAGCSGLPASGDPPPGLIAGAEPADHLIQEGEVHLARLWKLTSGGENAEGYFSFAGDRLVLQRRNPEEGVDCDRIYVTDSELGELRQVSDGRGVTTCAYFLPGDREVVYGSTTGAHETCPPPPDRAKGYVWALYPEYELWATDLETGTTRQLTDSLGYDAEATVSPLGDRIVFTSTRSGDVELWTCDLDGGDLRQVTDSLGYDGGAFFSHDGTKLVFRATEFPEDAAEREAAHQRYRDLLAEWLVMPSSMELYVVDADGSDRRKVTDLGKANWAPFFFPDDSRIIFATNHHNPPGHRGMPNFDLFAIGVDGEGLERITRYEGFDSFPMFSPDGRWLVFASNRGGATMGETNLFLAEWR